MSFRLDIRQSLIVVVVLLLFGALVTGAGVGGWVLDRAMEDSVLEAQTRNMRVAASFFDKSFSCGTEYSETGDVEKLTVDGMPDIRDHAFIDDLGEVIGETATIFAWNESGKDFIRVTTNIKKDNGQRAVGTYLGKTGRVYPEIVRGGVYRGEATILGKDYYTQYNPIFRKNDGKVIGILYVGMDKKKFIKDRNHSLLVIAESMSVVSVLAILLMVHTVWRLLSPFPVMAHAITSLAEGDLDTKIPYAEKNNEFGNIARALKHLQENLKKNKQLEEQAKYAQKKELERGEKQHEIVRDFSSVLSGALKTVGDKVGTVTNSSSGLADLSKRVSTLSHDVAEIAKTTDQHIQTVAASSEELRASFHEINRQTENARNLSRSARESADSASGSVRNLTESASRISEIINLITDIAEQTNLLALNATIEAARAGEAGKGFAVVANEVKNLASQTASATQDIASQISGITSVINDVAEKIGQVAEEVTHMDEGMDGIASAVTEQDAANQEISRNVSSTADEASKTTSSMAELASLADQVLSVATKLGDAAMGLTDQSARLEGTAQNFFREVEANAVAS